MVMLPRDSAGFRLRGLNMTRIETFTDATFAFSLTLLVISMDPPTTMASLDAALRQIPSFLLSASLLMMFWAGHHNWSRRFGMDDAATIVLSCLLVFTVLVYVYPLRFMFSTMMAWIGSLTDLPLGPERGSLGIRTLEDVNRMFAVYGLGFIAMSSAVALLNYHAWRHRDALGLDEIERGSTRAELGAWCILIGAGVLSTFIAVAFPHAIPTAGWAYALLAIAMPLYGRQTRLRSAATVQRLGLVPVVLLISCGGQPAPAPVTTDVRADVERALGDALTRITQLTDSVDDVLKPVALLTPAQEGALRQYGNEAHLARARTLGVRPADSVGIAALRSSGRLVELEDSTALWAVRELEHSEPLVTPDVHALLTRLALRFHERLNELDLPGYRLEITSVLRTATSQADLRESNVNAAAGESTHEFGTTLDIAYSSFAAPQDPELRIDLSAVPWLEPQVDRIASAFLEMAAARKSRELQAILGGVLLEFQRAGDVLVTLERQQPVFHITVARRQTL